MTPADVLTRFWPKRRVADAPGTPRAFKIALLSITGFLVVAAVYTSFLVMQRQRTLEAVSRYDSTWLLSQAAVETARLEGAVGAYALDRTEDKRDEVQLRVDILSNRVRLLDSGQVRGFIAEFPDLREIELQFRHTVTSAQALVDRIDEPGMTQRLLSTLSTLNPKLMRLASSAYADSGTMASEDLAQLSFLHWLFSGVLAAMILWGFGLIGVLTWHNRLLRRAHQEVNQLVSNLQETSGELSDANQRAHEAMNEVRQQNEVLRRRDVELNTQNARFDAALNNMSQALCMADSDQRLIVCNVRFQELFGLSP
ncbi:MAG: PAS-domain containing protein, partial [Acetobacteraceae bacterium]